MRRWFPLAQRIRHFIFAARWCAIDSRTLKAFSPTVNILSLLDHSIMFLSRILAWSQRSCSFLLSFYIFIQIFPSYWGRKLSLTSQVGSNTARRSASTVTCHKGSIHKLFKSFSDQGFKRIFSRRHHPIKLVFILWSSRPRTFRFLSLRPKFIIFFLTFLFIQLSYSLILSSWLTAWVTPSRTSSTGISPTPRAFLFWCLRCRILFAMVPTGRIKSTCLTRSCSKICSENIKSCFPAFALSIFRSWKITHWCWKKSVIV